nr:nestin-like [Nerophis lumbriciformis]
MSQQRSLFVCLKSREPRGRDLKRNKKNSPAFEREAPVCSSLYILQSPSSIQTHTLPSTSSSPLLAPTASQQPHLSFPLRASTLPPAMDLHIPAHSRLMAQEKQQMLELNRRLQSYLGRVKLLEEENSQLAQEIKALRHGHHGGAVKERNLKIDLHRAREELEEVWRQRAYAQMEVCKLNEEMEIVKWHWQKEVRAREEIGSKMELSRKELEEELGAHMWLRDRINQLEQEMDHLLHTHEQDVAHLNATLIQSAPPCFTPMPDLHQLEQELSQRASMAWQETAEAYQAQLDQLQESLKETTTRLDQTERHKNEYTVQLNALERERICEVDVRRQLEETAEQQREEHRQHVHALQEHLDDLENEKQHLGQKLELLLQENRGLLQQKMSMGLEVVTYRALLDSESLRRNDVALMKDSRNISFKDMSVKPLRGNYQRPARRENATSVWRPQTTSTTPLRSKFITVNQVQRDEVKTTNVDKQPYPKIVQNGAVEEFRAQEVDEKVTYAEPLSSPSQEEPEERPAEVVEEENSGKSVETVVHSGAPPSEELGSLIIESKNKINQSQSSTQEPKLELLGIREENFGSSDGFDQELPSVPVEEKAVVDFQLRLGAPKSEDLGSLIIEDKNEINQSKLGTQEPKSELLGITEDIVSSSVDWDQESSGVPVEKKAEFDLQLQFGAPPLMKDIAQSQSGLQELTSDLPNTSEETFSSSAGYDQEQSPSVLVAQKAAVNFQLQSEAPPPITETDRQPLGTQEPKPEFMETFINTTSIPSEAWLENDMQEEMSSSGTEALLEATPESRTGSSSSQCDVTEIGQEINYSTLGTTMTEAVDVLYPDGEEMDTWDSVIEKKVQVESSEPQIEVERQYAEPEEDISTRRSEMSRKEIKKEEDQAWRHCQEHPPPHDDEDFNDEDEDSQNVSVSWRTELESDSYAQENTLADTRPLIRYTSDETDANTLASHVDESDISDGEHDGKTGETVGPGWSESKAKNFGTMEDLCEEVEEEVLESSSGLKKVSGVHLEDLPTDAEDVELETDRLVEQELENLSTDGYASHFAQALANERKVLLSEDDEEDPELLTMVQKVIAESDVQVERKKVFLDYVQCERGQEVEKEEEVKDEIRTLEGVMKSDIEVERDQEFKESVQPKEEVEEKVQDDKEVIIESANTDEEVEQNLDLMEPHLDTVDDVEKIPDEIKSIEQEELNEENFYTDPDVQEEDNLKFDATIPPHSDTTDYKTKKMVGVNLKSHMDSDLQTKDNLDPTDFGQLQLGSMDDNLEKVKEGLLKQEEVQDMHLLSCTESDLQVESNLELQPQLDTPDYETKKVEVNLKSHMDSDLQAKDNLDPMDFGQLQLDSTDDNLEEVQEGLLKQEEAQEVHLLSCTESDLQVESNLELQLQSDSLDDDSLEVMKEKEVQDEMMTTEQEEADEVNSPSYTDLDVQVEDLRDFVLPQVDSPDDDLSKVQDEILTQEEAQKVYLLSCEESEVQEKPNPNMRPQSGSPDNKKKDEDELMTVGQEETNRVNLPSWTDHVVQVEGNLDLGAPVQPPLDSLDVILTQEVAPKVSLPVCIDADVQFEENLDVRDIIRPQLESPDDERVKDGSESPEKQELDVSMVTHVSESFSEFLSGPCLEEEQKHMEMQQSEPQNKGLLHLEEEWAVLENTIEDVDVQYSETEEESVDSQVGEERGDVKGAATIEEGPVKISLKETVIFPEEDSSTKFHQSNGKHKRDFWASSLEAAAYGSDVIATETSEIHDVEFGAELDWGKAVNGSSAHTGTVTKVHSEDLEIKGEPWSSGND